MKQENLCSLPVSFRATASQLEKFCLIDTRDLGNKVLLILVAPSDSGLRIHRKEKKLLASSQECDDDEWSSSQCTSEAWLER
jgi:hypothetical protein